MNKQRKPESPETNRARQQRLRERRKAQGFKRITLWLSPEQVDTLEVLGGEPWLGTTVKTFLEHAVTEHSTPPKKQSTLFGVSKISTSDDTVSDTDKNALWAEADSLNTSGLSWGTIATQWNQAGRRTPNGTVYRGGNIARAVRKWKGG